MQKRFGVSGFEVFQYIDMCFTYHHDSKELRVWFEEGGKMCVASMREILSEGYL